MTTGLVAVAGRTATKPSVDVAPDEVLSVRDAGPRWVGRAAHKLAAGLQAWEPEGLSAQGRRCIDIGASTGGFTQVLLAWGAASVVAVDVGHGQLVARLARDPRVVERSGTTVRGLRPEDVGGVGDLVVADLSFISLTLVMPELTGLLATDGDLVVLVKPQFEVWRARLSRQGVVTSPGDRESAVLAVAASVHESGLRVRGIRRSPITGTTGNSEYLLWARSDPSDTMSGDRVRELVRAITSDEAGGAR